MFCNRIIKSNKVKRLIIKSYNRMINANELRIGNKIILLGIDYNNGNALPDPKRSITTTVDADIIQDVVRHGRFYSPIPLTQQILEESGFAKTEQQNVFSIRNSYIGKIEDNYFFCEYDDNNYNSFDELGYYRPICAPFKYVHQLQNLYFFLTGEELKIEL